MVLENNLRTPTVSVKILSLNLNFMAKPDPVVHETVEKVPVPRHKIYFTGGFFKFLFTNLALGTITVLMLVLMGRAVAAADMEMTIFSAVLLLLVVNGQIFWTLQWFGSHLEIEG